MISIEFISGPDTTLLGLYQSNFNYLTIGTHKKNSIIIHDPNLLNYQFTLMIRDDLLYIKSESDKAYFLVSGKKFYGKKNLRSDDLLKVGETTIKIISFKYSTIVGKSLTQRFKEATNNKPELVPLLENLEAELVDLEKL